jgi:hypothetical protein
MQQQKAKRRRALPLSVGFGTFSSPQRYTKFWIYTLSFSRFITDGALVFFGGGGIGAADTWDASSLDFQRSRGRVPIVTKHRRGRHPRFQSARRCPRRKSQRLRTGLAPSDKQLGQYPILTRSCARVGILALRIIPALRTSGEMVRESICTDFSTPLKTRPMTTT